MLVILAMSVTATAQPAQHTVNFGQSDLTFSKLKGGDRVKYDLVEAYFRGNMCSLEGEPGTPMLPACDVRILLPAGAKVASLEASVGEEIALDGIFNIYPAQPPYVLSGNPPPFFVPPDSDAYNSSTPIPDKIAELVDTTIIRGYHIAIVRVYPVVYVPATGHLSLRATFDLSLNLEESPAVLSYSAPEPLFEDFVKANVINPQILATEYETARLLSPTDPNDVKYLLIGDPSMFDEFQPLLDWKTKKGVPAEAISVDWIYNNYSGSSNQEKIKACIKDYAQNKGTVWVVLAGDNTIVPDHNCFAETGGAPLSGRLPSSAIAPSYGETDSTIPTDWYYAGLDDMNWNDDGDSQACETGDTIDLGPDVFVGRFPIRTAAHATAIVNKTLQYEKDILSANFAEKLLLAGTRLWDPGDAEGKSEKMYDEYIEPYWNGVRYRFYDTATDFSGGSSYNLTRANVNEQLENGYNLFHMATHGNTTIWGMESGSSYNTSYASSVNNTDKYVNIVTIACITNAFDSSTDPCLGEAFIRNPDGGAVTYIGSSRYGLGQYGVTVHGASFKYDRMIYQYLFTGEPAGFGQQIGAAYAKAKEYWAGSCATEKDMRWIQFALNLMGDPELPLYTYNPSTFSPSYDGSITTGSQTYVVETGVANAKVCLSKGSEVYACGSADSSGRFTATINPTSTGTMDVTITALNYYPHEGTTTVSSGGPTSTPTSPPPPTNTPTPTGVPPTPTPTSQPSVVFFDDFETSQGWVVDPNGNDTATTGTWERANPESTSYSGVTYQLGTTVSGSYDLVTEGSAGSSVGSYDIDGGDTTVRSPNITLPSSGDVTLSFSYYLAHYSNATSDDYLRVKVVGSTTQTVFEELGAGNTDGAVWDTFSTSLNAFRGQTIYLLIEAADGGGGSLVEAAIDDVLIESSEVPPPTPTPTTEPPTPTPTGVPPTPTPTGVPPTPTPTSQPGVVFFDDFETSQVWTTNPFGDDAATTGLWERANPEGTEYSGVTYQLGTTVSGSYDLVTEGSAGSSVGSYDIDNGDTTIRSPDITLPSSGDITLSFSYYLAHYSNATSDDYLRVKVVGSTTQTVFEELGAGNTDGAVWDTFSTSLNDFRGQTVYLLIEAADGGGGSLIEAAIDDVLIASN